MYMAMNFKSIIQILLFSTIVVLLCGSCGDEVTGCTDPEGENYDVNATVSGDCVYARDKFLGTFLGVFTCPGSLEALSNDSIQFTIIEGLDSDIKSDIILELIVDGFPLAIAGTVEGNELILMQELTNVPIPILSGELPGDVTAVGVAMMTNGDQSLTATLNLDVIVEIYGMPLTIMDACGISGEKQ